MEKILKEMLKEQKKQTKILQSIESRLKEVEMKKIVSRPNGGKLNKLPPNVGVPSFYESNN